MDRICCCVLEKLSTLVPLGRYVVVSAEELFENFPEDADKSYSELKKALKTLNQDGYIDLKYQDGEFFCAAQLKNYSQPEPSAETVMPAVPPQTKPQEKRFKNAAFIPAFAGGLLGGAAGSLIISLIFALV